MKVYGDAAFFLMFSSHEESTISFSDSNGFKLCWLNGMLEKRGVDMMLMRNTVKERRRCVKAGILLIGTVQYFIAEWITAKAWVVVPYSWQNNDISDLGVPECYFAGENGLDRTICSPLHNVMNISFLLQALLVLVSTILIWNYISAKKRTWISILILMFVAGLSLVALFPGSMSEALGGDNTRALLHTIGAVSAIIGGNLVSITVGSDVLWKYKSYGFISMLLGVIGLTAGILLVTGFHFGLGSGGIERVAVNAIMIWFIISGMMLLHRKEIEKE